MSEATPAENRRIARAAGVVGGLTLVSRVAGLARDVVVGYYFGTGTAADAFFVAFRIPNLLRRFVGEGAMNVAFIPVFAEYLTRRSRREAVAAAQALVGQLTALLLVLTALGVGLAPVWVRLFAPGFVAEPAKLALTVRLTRFLFPYILLVSLVAVCGGFLNALRHFVAPAASPVLLNLSIIGAAVVLCPRLEQPVYALVVGVLVGGLLQLGLQVGALLRERVALRPRWSPGHPAVRRVFWLMGPTLFGAAVYQLNLMLDTVLASALPSGSVSFLWYAARVFEFPLGIFAVALGTAALPSFSSQAARGALGELRGSLRFALRLTSLVAVPAAVGLFVLAEPITAVLFQRGAFGPEQVRMTAWALANFAVGLWSVSVVRVITPVYYALGDARTPALTAAASFAANAAFSVMLMGPVPAAGGSRLVHLIAAATATLGIADLRHAGLALATSLAATVNLALLVAVLARRLGGLGLGPVGTGFLRVGLAAAAMVLPVRAIVGAVDWTAGAFVPRLAALAGAVGTGVGVFLVALVLLGGDEIRLLQRLVRGEGGLPASR